MSESPFEQQALNDNTWVIRATARLDNENAEEMLAALQDAKTGGYKNVRIDCERMEFISSAGVGSLLATVEDFRESGGDILLFHVPQPILHVLKVLDLADYLTVEDTLDDTGDRVADDAKRANSE